MTGKFTPAPWLIGPSQYKGEVVVSVDPAGRPDTTTNEGIEIAVCRGPDRIANGRLIVAAPSMAMTLAIAVNDWRDAIDAPDDEDGEINGGDMVDWYCRWQVLARAALDLATEGGELPTTWQDELLRKIVHEAFRAEGELLGVCDLLVEAGLRPEPEGDGA